MAFGGNDPVLERTGDGRPASGREPAEILTLTLADPR
jgi:hypothetical protein